MAQNPPDAPDRRFGKGLRMSSVVLASALVALVAQLVLDAIEPMDVITPGDAATEPLAVAASMGAAGVSAGAALMLAALLLPRVNHAVRATQVVGVVVWLASLVPIVLTWSELANPVGLVLLHTLVAIVVLLGLDWAMDDVATVDA